MNKKHDFSLIEALKFILQNKINEIDSSDDVISNDKYYPRKLQKVIEYFKRRNFKYSDEYLMYYINEFCKYFQSLNNPDQNFSRKIFNDKISKDHIFRLIKYVNDASYENDLNSLILNAINHFGSIIDFPIYRGISYGELESIQKRIDKSSRNLRLEKAKSFSSDYSIAQEFSDFGDGSHVNIELKKTHKYKSGGVISLETRKPVFDMSTFYNAYIAAKYICSDEIDVSYYSTKFLFENEFIVSDRDVFEVVDLENLEFKIV